MNIYQHLLFLLPITGLLYFGVVRFLNKVEEYGALGTLLAALSTAASIALLMIYVLVNKHIPLEFYNWLGTL